MPAPTPISGMFDSDKIQEELQREMEERRKKLFATNRNGSPGKISTLMGYGADTTINPTTGV